MKLNILAILFMSLIGNASAEDAKMPCRYKDGTLGLNSLDKFDCKIANKLSSDPKIKEELKNHIDKKLALKVSKKAADLIEDLALMDSYFQQNDIDLGDNDNVKASCKLDKIAEPACMKDLNKDKKDKFQKKMSMILSSDKYLPKTSDEGANKLYKKMLAKAQQVRNSKKIEESKSCPIDGNSGKYILSSQFTVADAETIIELIKKGNKGSGLEKIYSSYPQLNIYLSSKSSDQKKKFESVMASYNGEMPHKAFVNKFFKDENTQKEMAKNVSLKCDELKESIETFVCNDNYPHLAMKEDDREVFFDDSGDDKIFKEVSRGLSCELETKAEESSNYDIFTVAGSVQDKSEYFSKDVRGEDQDDQIKKTLEPFCEMYQCKGAKVLPEMNSCKKGGPISSDDILKLCNQNKINECDPKVQKYYSYVKLLENDAKNAGVQTGSLANESSSSSSIDGSPKKTGFTSFYQNFLGVEGTIAAEGKKITPITIAEKKAEFVEKKLDTTTASLSQSREKETARPDQARQEQIMPSHEETLETQQPITREADDFRRTFTPQQFSKTNYELGKDANGKQKKVKFTDTDSSTLDEMKKLRGELADALGKVKGSDEERLAAIADNNAIVVAPKGTTPAAIKSLSSGEKERLDSYRENLNNWESRLRTWQNNLNDRDVRVNSGSSSADARVEAPAPVADQANGANASANAMRLSKTSTANSAGAAKGEAGSERSPGTEKVEGEAGVVNSENLATLEAGSLSKLGITVSDSFIIKVRHKDKIYSVPVKTFNYDGKNMFVPLLNEKDRELSKIVYDSPLFKDYREYQKDRQYKLEQQKR